MWYRISNQLQLPETDVPQNPVEPEIQEEEQEQPQLLETEKPTQSLFFSEWARDHYVPTQPVYHGTTHDFDEFKVINTGDNSLGDGFYFTSEDKEAERFYTGKGGDQMRQIDRIATDFADSYYGNDDELFDLLGEKYPEEFEDGVVKDIYQLGEKIGSDQILGGKPKVIPAHIRMKNPFVLTQMNPNFPYSPTVFYDDFQEEEIPEADGDDGYDPEKNESPEKLIYEDNGNQKKYSFKTLIHKLYDVLLEYYEDYNAYEFINQVILDNANPGEDINAMHIFQSITNQTEYFKNQYEDDYHSEIVKKLMESLGFDSIVQDPSCFWPSNEYEPGTQHYFLWKPENVKHARENIEFNPDNRKIYSAYMFNPEGQGVLDLGIKLKYDPSNYEARIEKERNDKNSHMLDIGAYIKGTDIKLGQIDLFCDKRVPPEERFVDVELVMIYDNNKSFKQQLRQQYNPVEVDEFSGSRVKWGIGEFLYSSARQLIQEKMPEVKYIAGNIHSKEAFKSRNKAFGDPLEIKDVNTDTNISQLDAQKQIPYMVFDEYTEQPDFQPDEAFWVKHNVV